MNYLNYINYVKNNLNRNNADDNELSTYFEYYTIGPGEDLYEIANKFKINVNDLAFINNIKNLEYITDGEVIVVPKTDTIVYITEEGDTIKSIEKKLDIPEEEIVNYNNNIYLVANQLLVFRDK